IVIGEKCRGLQARKHKAGGWGDKIPKKEKPRRQPLKPSHPAPAAIIVKIQKHTKTGLEGARPLQKKTAASVA
ncbi:MAG: hypothetical protein P1U57_15080, partial [Oleibacter sp.]|nr:hypothetical protein [Thalassolituus sp.]